MCVCEVYKYVTSRRLASFNGIASESETYQSVAQCSHGAAERHSLELINYRVAVNYNRNETSGLASLPYPHPPLIPSLRMIRRHQPLCFV